MKRKKFALLGGDLRTLAAGKFLFEKGFDIYVFGFEKSDKNDFLKTAKTLESALSGADYALLPLPLSSDGKTLCAPFGKEETLLSDIFLAADAKTIFFGGNIPENIKDGVHTFVDYFKREDFQIMNAVPTAEGAIAEAIKETEFTLWKSRCLVIGFGRIGKILALKLKALGADVTVSARKEKDLAMISALGMNAARSEKLGGVIFEQDIVFNTVPVLLIGEKELSEARKNTLFIDLSSKPGGIDFELAKKAGLKVLWLLSLPGKTAPETAGKIIADTVINILEGGFENDG